jgi:hypothetical protein
VAVLAGIVAFGGNGTTTPTPRATVARAANAAGTRQNTSPTATPIPAATAIEQTGITYDEICNIAEGDMTDAQLEAHAEQFTGETFTGWQGWVYDVVSRADGDYDLHIAMSERGFLWSRNIVVENIPDELAQRLNVEQPLLFDGRIARVEYMFEVMCNPMIVDSFVLRE